MLTRFSWGLAGCLLAVALVASAGAQEGQKGGRGRGGGILGRDSLISLAGNEAVQKELGADEATVGKIRSVTQEYRDALESEAPFNLRDLQNLSDDERRTKMRERNEKRNAVTAKFEPKLKEALNADQFKRLQGIYVQVAGAEALINPAVSRELALTDDQIKKIAEIRADYEQKTRGLFGQGAGEDARAKFSELREEQTKKVSEVLTKEQQDKLTALKGKEFDQAQLRQGRGDGKGGGRPGAKGKNRPKTE